MKKDSYQLVNGTVYNNKEYKDISTTKDCIQKNLCVVVVVALCCAGEGHSELAQFTLQTMES